MPPFLSLIPTLQMGPGKVGVGGLVIGIKVRPESMGGLWGGGPQRSEWALKSERAGAAVATSGEGSRWLPSRKGKDTAQFCAN